MKKYFSLLVLMFCWNLYSAWGYLSPFQEPYDVFTNGIYYKLDETNKTATVSYKGEYHSFNNQYWPTSNYSGNLVIPETITYMKIAYTVTELDYNCFYDCRNLTSVSIPKSVRSLSGAVFRDCATLETIVLDADNPVFDARDNCNAIIVTSTNQMIVGCKETHIPNTVTSLGDDCFSSRSSLTSITIPSSVTSLGESCFEGCI